MARLGSLFHVEAMPGQHERSEMNDMYSTSQHEMILESDWIFKESGGAKVKQDVRAPTLLLVILGICRSYDGRKNARRPFSN